MSCPPGVVFEAFEGKNADKGTASGQSLTWNLGVQPAGSYGSVRVRVKISEDAVKGAQGAVGTVNNAATITVGNKSYTGTTTNYVPKKTESDARIRRGRASSWAMSSPIPSATRTPRTSRLR